MSLKTFFSRALAATTLGAAVFMAPAALAQSASHTLVDPAQPSDTAGKTEILEFFAYSCPHCAAMEPLVEKWAKTLPEDTVLKRVPVAFNASMADLQKLYYSLESLGRLDLHPAVFKAIHQERKRIYTQDAIIDWVAEQGMDKAKFESVFKSFGVQTKIARANELTETYGVQGTPSLAVGGKYLVSPSMTGSYQGTIEGGQRLLESLKT